MTQDFCVARWGNARPEVNRGRKYLCCFHEEMRTTGMLFQFMLEIRLITIPQEKINPLLL